MARRRDLFKALAAGAVSAPLAAACASVPESCAPSALRQARGIEGQRRADLGDGTCLNPVLAGDVGQGFSAREVKTWQYAQELERARQPRATRRVRLRVRVRNDAHVATWSYSHDEGRSWTVHGTRMEVSGLHHNVFGGFLSLRIGLYACGGGGVHLRDFRHRAIAETDGSDPVV